ncbi:spondin domain-containing protein [Rasiella sp. SM2506]|uniref:T9SS type A sorting domain-containing protein n=1 Tax=Rasiella sp. SM2506 TaxID=3423914 RepID=UPI003D7B9CC1
MKKNTLFALFTLLTFSLGISQSTATYSVVFESNWSQATHPHTTGSLPSGAHWSKLVGATHTNEVSFWEINSIASAGIEAVAEQGSNGAFFAEINAAIDANTANNLVEGPSLGTAAGQMVINTIETNSDYPMLTLVSMIAPSPDWMIGVNSIALLDSFGEWRESIVIDLYPIDAGTDSGNDYSSPNADTNPKQNITSAQGITPFSNEKIGTLTITLKTILGVHDSNSTKLKLFPNPTKGAITISLNNAIKTIDIYDVLGKKVMTANVQNEKTYTLDLQALSNGVYIAQITDFTNAKVIKKIIKQ